MHRWALLHTIGLLPLSKIMAFPNVHSSQRKQSRLTPSCFMMNQVRWCTPVGACLVAQCATAGRQAPMRTPFPFSMVLDLRRRQLRTQHHRQLHLDNAMPSLHWPLMIGAMPIVTRAIVQQICASVMTSWCDCAALIHGLGPRWE